MRHLSVREFEVSLGVPLSPDERDALLRLGMIVTLRPSIGSVYSFDIEAAGFVGAVEFPTLSLEIRPKVPLESVLFMVSYAIDPSTWRNWQFGFDPETSLVEAVALGFAGQLRRATARGILQGYRAVEESLATVRGRIRIEDQLRNWFGRLPPVEVRYDEFTDDILENRLLKAALRRLSRMHLRSVETRIALRHLEALFVGVEDVYVDPRAVPAVVYTRLNSHYRSAVELARLILRSSGWELRQGAARASSFFVDMAGVFEEFLFVALREHLGDELGELRRGDGTLRLDAAGSVRLRPDFSWWKGSECQFVADAKYKVASDSGLIHPDLYQLLAYAIASGLPGGLLVYAHGPTAGQVHEVVHVAKSLEVMALDLAKEPARILEQVGTLAARVSQRIHGAGVS